MTIAAPMRRVGTHSPWIAVVSLALLLSACGEAEVVEPPPQVLPIKMFTVSGSDSGALREYPGNISAGQHVDMAFEVSGKIIDFRHVEGTRVKEGDILARLDPRDFEADLKTAEANLKKATIDLDRYTILYEKDVAPKAQLEEMQQRADVSQADLEKAKKAFQDSVLRAPFDGVVAKKLVEDFENIRQKQAVLILQDDSFLRIRVTVPESDLAGREGSLDLDAVNARIQPKVIVASLPDDEFPARLRELALTADPVTRTFDATFAFDPQKGLSVLPGMTAKVVIRDAAQGVPKGFSVPSAAVTADDDGKSLVWKVNPATNTVSPAYVKMGELFQNRVEILEGLAEGDVVATSGVSKLRDGDEVRQLDFSR